LTLINEDKASLGLKLRGAMNTTKDRGHYR